MTVVVVITILALVALPGIARQLEGRQSRKSGDIVASMYRTARLRAMGRGGAQLVRYENGTFQALEAVQGTHATEGCRTLPATSCLNTNWAAGNAENRELSNFDATGNGQLDVSAHLPLDGTPPTYLDICFTPLGRAYFRTAAASPFAELVQAPRIEIQNASGIGLRREVAILPNGNARVMAQ